MAKLTISIVTYNGAAVIADCLKSLQAQTFEDVELIVVDNASQDDTLEVVRQYAPEATIIALSQNVGFGAGHNIAIRQAAASWVLVLNQDVVLKSNALEQLYDATLRGDVAVIGPCLLRSAHESPAIIDTAGLEKTWYYRFTDRGSSKPLHEGLQRSGYVWGISGACMLLRKQALQQIAYGQAEYFDESFFMYKEDIDLCIRLKREGWKAWYEASAIGYHRRTARQPRTTTQTAAHRRRMPTYVKQYSYRNQWYLILKHTLFVLLPFIALYEILKFGYILLSEPRTLALVPDIIKSLPRLVKRRYGIST